LVIFLINFVRQLNRMKLMRKLTSVRIPSATTKRPPSTKSR